MTKQRQVIAQVATYKLALTNALNLNLPMLSYRRLGKIVELMPLFLPKMRPLDAFLAKTEASANDFSIPILTRQKFS